MDGSRTRVLKEGVLQHQTLTSPVYDDVGNCVAPAEYAWEGVSLDLSVTEEVDEASREWRISRAELAVWSLSPSGAVESLVDQVSLHERCPVMHIDGGMEAVFVLSFPSMQPMVLKAPDSATRQSWIEVLRVLVKELHPQQAATAKSAIEMEEELDSVPAQLQPTTPRGHHPRYVREMPRKSHSVDLTDMPVLAELNKRNQETASGNGGSMSNSQTLQPSRATSPLSPMNVSRSQSSASGSTLSRFTSLITRSSSSNLAGSSSSGGGGGGGERSGPSSAGGSATKLAPTAPFRFTSRFRSSSSSDSRKLIDDPAVSRSLEFASTLLEKYDEFLEAQNIRRPQSADLVHGKNKNSRDSDVDLTPEQRRDAFMLNMLNSSLWNDYSMSNSSSPASAPAPSPSLRTRIMSKRESSNSVTGSSTPRRQVVSMYDDPVITKFSSAPNTSSPPLSGISPFQRSLSPPQQPSVHAKTDSSERETSFAEFLAEMGDDEAPGISRNNKSPTNAAAAAAAVASSSAAARYSMVHSAHQASSSIGEERKMFDLLNRVQSTRRDDQRVVLPPPPKLQEIRNGEGHARSRSDDADNKRRRANVKRQVDDLHVKDGLKTAVLESAPAPPLSATSSTSPSASGSSSTLGKRSSIRNLWGSPEKLDAKQRKKEEAAAAAAEAEAAEAEKKAKQSAASAAAIAEAAEKLQRQKEAQQAATVASIAAALANSSAGVDYPLDPQDTQIAWLAPSPIISEYNLTMSSLADAASESAVSISSSTPRPAMRLTGVRGIVSDGLNGYMNKRITGAFGRVQWVKRFFVIKDGLLMYRKKEKDGRLEFAANLANAKVSSYLTPEQRQWAFQVETSYKTLVLQASTESQMKTWVQGIRHVGEELTRYRPDGKIHFKCSYNNVSKRLCVNRQISIQALNEYLLKQFDIKEACVISYIDNDEQDLIFIRTQSDLDEAFVTYDQKTILRMFITEHSNAAALPSKSTMERRSVATTLSDQPPVKLNWIQGELLGAGSTGQVYLGLNVDTGRLMAVKQVAHERSEDDSVNIKGRVLALMKEMEVLRSLHHANIVQYIGMEHEGNFTNVFLEYVPGGSIHALLTKFGGFDEKLIRVYIRQVLSGLRYLHANGLIHRDIKGANILVDTTGVVKLADFGMASKILAGVNHTTNGGKVEMAGTPYWMAPEVIKRLSFGKAADIWSVGCTIIEMATAKPPWNHFSQEIAAIFHIANAREPPKIPSWLSNTAQEFLTLCLKLNPAERPDVEVLLKHPFINNERSAMDSGSKSISSSSSAESVDTLKATSESRNNSLARSPSSQVRKLSETPVPSPPSAVLSTLPASLPMPTSLAGESRRQQQPTVMVASKASSSTEDRPPALSVIVPSSSSSSSSVVASNSRRDSSGAHGRKSTASTPTKASIGSSRSSSDIADTPHTGGSPVPFSSPRKVSQRHSTTDPHSRDGSFGSEKRSGLGVTTPAVHGHFKSNSMPLVEFRTPSANFGPDGESLMSLTRTTESNGLRTEETLVFEERERGDLSPSPSQPPPQALGAQPPLHSPRSRIARRSSKSILLAPPVEGSFTASSALVSPTNEALPATGTAEVNSPVSSGGGGGGAGPAAAVHAVMERAPSWSAKTTRPSPLGLDNSTDSGGRSKRNSIDVSVLAADGNSTAPAGGNSLQRARSASAQPQTLLARRRSMKNVMSLAGDSSMDNGLLSVLPVPSSSSSSSSSDLVSPPRSKGSSGSGSARLSSRQHKGLNNSADLGDTAAVLIAAASGDLTVMRKIASPEPANDGQHDNGAPAVRKRSSSGGAPRLVTHKATNSRDKSGSSPLESPIATTFPSSSLAISGPSPPVVSSFSSSAAVSRPRSSSRSNIGNRNSTVLSPIDEGVVSGDERKHASSFSS